MQREHVAYALGRLAGDFAGRGDFETAQALFGLGFNATFIELFAEKLRQANESELVNNLISERVVREQREAKSRRSAA